MKIRCFCLNNVRGSCHWSLVLTPGLVVDLRQNPPPELLHLSGGPSGLLCPRPPPEVPCSPMALPAGCLPEAPGSPIVGPPSYSPICTSLCNSLNCLCLPGLSCAWVQPLLHPHHEWRVRIGNEVQIQCVFFSPMLSATLKLQKKDTRQQCTPIFLAICDLQANL